MNANQNNLPVLHTCSFQDRLRANAKRHVLICEPQLCSYDLPFLPAIYGVLKTYWETHAQHQDQINWLPPVHTMDPPEQIVSALKNTPIDVLGLSCYTWNWRLQQEVARRIKQSHPQCLIVAGGPHPDYGDPSFFEENPYIDAVVVKNGEVPFNRILSRVLSYPEMTDFYAADKPLDDIPGLCLPHTNGALTAPPESPNDYNTSAYLAQRDYYEQFIDDHPQGVVAAWETSRGCPFRCSYCDWGSSTMSKVRRFDMDRLKAEIEWFAQSKVRVLFSVDSNFGMFKTDVDLTDWIVAAKEKHGHPYYFIYSNAKNVPDRTIEITRKVVGAGLDTAHTLSIQHSSLDVLQATERENISIEKQIQVVRELQDEGIPISVQLILGLPKDTPELWRTTFSDLMEWGIHDGHTVTNYHLLPNAPAAAPEYRKRWDIQGIERYIYDGNGVRPNDPIDKLTYARGEIIVATSTFSRQDWVQMSTESAVLRALHNAGLTQSIARALRCSYGISYHAFYSDLLDNFLPNNSYTQGLIETLKTNYNRFLQDDTYLALLPMPVVPDSNEHVEPHRWFLSSICFQPDAFYQDLAKHLLAQYPAVDVIESLCHFQRSVLVLPSYDKTSPTQIPIDHDWPSYFDHPSSIIPDANPLAIEATPKATLTISDTSWDDLTGRANYNWTAGNEPDAWRRWFHTMITGRLSATKCNHQQLSLAVAVH